MMLFSERDLEVLKPFLAGEFHANLLIRKGGFSRAEAFVLAEEFLGQAQKSNLLFLEPEDGKKLVSVAEVRSLRQSLALASKAGGERRLVVVSSNLGVQAQNAFLKVLEEPVAGVSFLLLAGSEEAFLPTISSRSQLFKLSGPTESEAVSFAVEASSIDPKLAKLIWLQSGKVVAEFVRLLEDEKARSVGMDVLGKAKGFVVAKEYERMKILKEFVKSKDDAEVFLKNLLVVLELASEKGHKEVLRFSGLVIRAESALAGLAKNANHRIELMGLVV